MPRRVYANLAQYLKQSGITQQEFADILGVSQSYISRVANGIQEPSLEMALQISEKANIPIESLVQNASPAQVVAESEGDGV
jgi:transcriptional regulator with XRE-family HTH domain